MTINPKLDKPFSLHVEIDIEAITESDGETFTVTRAMITDQLKYVFEKLQHKQVKIKYQMEVSPGEAPLSEEELIPLGEEIEKEDDS